MACCLYVAKPLSKPMLTYCQFQSEEQISVKFDRNSTTFIHKNAFEIAVCQNDGHFVQGEMS